MYLCNHGLFNNCSEINICTCCVCLQEMMRRLTAIIQVQQPLHPNQTSDIITEYKAKLAQYVFLYNTVYSTMF